MVKAGCRASTMRRRRLQDGPFSSPPYRRTPEAVRATGRGLIGVALKCRRRGTGRGQPEQQVLDGLRARQMEGDAGQGEARS